MKAIYCNRGHALKGNRTPDGRCVLCRRTYIKTYMRRYRKLRRGQAK